MEELCELELKILKELKDVSLLQNNLISKSRLDNSIISYNDHEKSSKKSRRNPPEEKKMAHFDTFRMKENTFNRMGRRKSSNNLDYASRITEKSLVLIEHEKNSRRFDGGRNVKRVSLERKISFKPSYMLLKAKNWDQKFKEKKSAKKVKMSNFDFGRDRSGSIYKRKSYNMLEHMNDKDDEDQYLEAYNDYLREKSHKKFSRSRRSFLGEKENKFKTPQKRKKYERGSKSRKKLRKVGPPNLRTPGRSARKQCTPEKYTFMPSLSKKSMALAKRRVKKNLNFEFFREAVLLD